MQVLHGTPNDETLFSGKAGWRKFMLEACDHCSEDDWRVDTRTVQNLLTEYLAFEAAGPVSGAGALQSLPITDRYRRTSRALLSLVGGRSP